VAACECNSALKYAFASNIAAADPNLKDKLSLLIGKYLR